MIPKSSTGTINDVTMLRPLGLLEVTRKLLTTTVCNRLKYAFHSRRVFFPSQNGFVSHKSTSSELVHLLHIISEGKTFDFPIDLITWDIVKAFDSVSRKIQYWSWRRLGTPSSIARWLVDLDENSTFIVKSPFAQNLVARHQLDRRSDALLALLRTHGFHPERGYTQGDVQSGLGWVTCYDMILTASSTYRPDSHLRVRSLGSSIAVVHPQAFADDLTTTTRPEYTQTQADLMSVGTWILGWKIAHNKIRATSSSLDQPTRQIIIHDWKWTSHTISFLPPDESVKILGVNITLRSNWDHCYKDLCFQLQSLTKLVCSKRGSDQTKAKIYRICLHMKILYPAVHANFTPEQSAKIDAIPRQMFRKISHLQPTTANHIMTTSYGGIRTPSISLDINKRKWNTIRRLLTEPIDSSGHIGASGMLRQIFELGVDSPMLTCSSARLDTSAQISKDLDSIWTGSIIRYVREHGLTLHFRGKPNATRPILEMLELTKHADTIRLIEDTDVAVLAELLTYNSSKQEYEPAQWIRHLATHLGHQQSPSRRHLNYGPLEEAAIRLNKECPQSWPPTVPLHAGQTLVLQYDNTYQYFNVNGINLADHWIEGSAWTTDDPRIHPADVAPFTQLTRDKTDYQTGTTWSHRFHYSDQGRIIGRMICSDDVTPQEEGLYYCLQFLPMRIDLDFSHLIHPRTSPDWAKNITDDLTRLGHKPVIIASDASHSIDAKDPILNIYATVPPRDIAYGAIVGATANDINEQDGFSLGIQVDLSTVPDISAYGSELIMGAATIQLLSELNEPHLQHRMDCQGAIRKLNDHNIRDVTRPYGDVLRCVWRTPHRNTLRYAPGHPKKGQVMDAPQKTMNAADYLSRHVESKDSRFMEVFPKNIYHVTAAEILHGMYQIGDVYITDEKNIPFVKSVFSDTTCQRLQFRKYCHTRVNKYKSHTNWHTCEGNIVPQMFNHLRRSTGLKSLITFTKQIYETFLTSYKQHQRNNTISEQCCCCPDRPTENAEHILYCSSIPRRMLRDAGISEIRHWVNTCGGMNERTSQLLNFLLDIIDLPEYPYSRRGLWTGLPQNRILQEAREYLSTTANWKIHHQKINSRAIMQFHIALLKHATTLWKLRCLECNATDQQREVMLKITTVTALREFMFECAKSTPRYFKRPMQTIIRKWLDCSRTPICIPRSQTSSNLKRDSPHLEEPLSTPPKRQKLVLDLEKGNVQEIHNQKDTRKRKISNNQQTLYSYFKPLNSENNDGDQELKRTRRLGNN